MEKYINEILKHLDNTHTKVESRENFKGNYYNYLTDTIYVGGKFENAKLPSKKDNVNKKAAMFIVACHECIHSIQSKCIHILNMIFSNISVILTIIAIILGLFIEKHMTIKMLTIICVVISMIIRFVLEIHAIKESTNIASIIIKTTEIDGVSEEDIQNSKKYMDKHKYVAFLGMILDKIVLLILVLLLA